MDARASPPLLLCTPLGGTVAAAAGDDDADDAMFDQLPIRLRDMRFLLWPLVLLEAAGGRLRCNSAEDTVLLELDRTNKRKPSALGLWPFMCALNASRVCAVLLFQHVKSWDFDNYQRRFILFVHNWGAGGGNEKTKSVLVLVLTVSFFPARQDCQ